MDSFFVNEDFEEDINDSYIRFNYRVTFEEARQEVVETDIKVRAKFPKISKKANLILEKINEDEDSNSFLTNDDQTLVKNELGDGLKNSRYAAALRYFLLEKKRWNISADAGMRVDVPLDPFVKFRLKRSFFYKKNEFSLIQKINYYRIDELSETSEFIWTRDMGDENKLKFEVSLGWEEKSPKFTGNHTLSFLHKLSTRRAISYSIGTSYIIKEAAYYNRYQIATNYRQLIFKDWIFVQGAIGTIFRKEEDFRSSEYISMAIDMVF
ncbi:hypothetical protein [Bacteriovorax sp. DB6_IX]|uniref:hypothetical protein n=1 Tax=Bacteriovorax sp. DB6_IX TaxID=1353530 RepID=UPI000389EFC9|nr:hypothetical protein [Bacteriovorax sp. DB6_IX]EQC52427.1 hypothetical protein M901_0518 [Bacteriovorax sp. DB6_IX]